MQQKMQLKICIYVVIVTEVFVQIRACDNIKERVQPETALVQAPKMLKKY